MASYHKLLHHRTPSFESPAKVFAKLKLKVQGKGICADSPITGNKPLCNVSDKHGAAVFKSPMKRAESTWMTEELTGDQRTGSYHNKAQAWTLSPISSPQKTFEYSDISKHVEEMPPVTERGRGHSPRKRAFLESTAVSHSSSLVNRKQIRTELPQIRDSGGFKVTSRTPVKVQPVEDDFESSVFVEECAPLMSPAYMFSPMRARLKRQREPQEFNNGTSSTKEVSNGSRSLPQERKTSRAFSVDPSTCFEGVGRVGGLSDDPSEVDQFTHKPVIPSPRSITIKRCYVPVQKCPLMSPSKMFAYMKRRESKTKQPEVHKVSSSTRDLFNTNNFHHNMGEMEDIAFRSVPESVAPVNRSRVESADSQSDSDPSEDALSLAVSPQPVLFEDSLLLNTPRISIPKKQETVFKRNKWPQSTKFPSESVIYLKKWFLRKNHKGLFVDGIHQDEKIPWNSNIIVDRVSNNVVKTVTGKVYILVDKMKMSLDSGLPNWLLKKFANGFPPDWEALYEKFLSQSRDDSSRETERNSEGRVVMLKLKTKSEASSIIGTVKRHRKTDSCLSASVSRPNVSRSGRVIKPPLEYWKGGRVLLDAHMNVTIHECYDTSICIPVSKRASQKPARVHLACSDGRQKSESASGKEGPLRRVKAPLRKRNSAKMKPEKKPSYSPEPPVEPLHSPEDWSGRQTRSSRRGPTAEKTLYVDTVPQKQRGPGKSSTKRSKKQTQDITSPSVSVSGSKRAVPAPPESDYKRSASSDDGAIGRKKSGKEVHRTRGWKGRNKPRPSYVFPSSESEPSDDKEEELWKRTRITRTKHKQIQRTKSKSPTKPLPTLTRSSKNNPKANKGNAAIPQEPDADEWTEAELMKLHEAVSYYPKHMTGYWTKVARLVGTRSAQECHFQHTSQGTCLTPAKRAKNPKKEKMEAPKDPVHQVISARKGTLKRKQQVRQFLKTMPREDVEDGFTSEYMQNKRFEMPSLCPSDHDFTLSEMEPLTPTSTRFPEVKTPQCLHITPGMMGSPNRSNNDKYVYQLQKRMEKNQFNVLKQAPSSKNFTPSPSMKRAMRKCGNTENDTFLVWEMFPGNDGALSESGEEDFYFSDDD